MPTPLTRLPLVLLLAGCELPWVSPDEHADRKADLDQDGFPTSVDCDDLDPALNPDAEEVCEDGVDQDCDGGPGPCTIGEVRADAADRLVLGGALGTAIAWGDLVGDGGYDLAIGGSTSETAPGLLVVATSDDVLADDVVPIAQVAGTSSDCIGRAASFVHNLSGSGPDQVVFGSPCSSAGKGTVKVGTWTDGSLATTQNDSVFDVATGIGRRVLGLEDATGDGKPDVAVTTDDRVAIVSGAAWSVPTSRVITSLTDAGGTFGDALAAGDVDDDGLADLVIGAPALATTGAVFVVTGLDDAKPRQLNALQDAIVGEVGSGFGYALAVCDLNGDDAPDLVASAPTVGSNHGAVLVFYGPDLAARSYEAADLLITSDLADGYFGYTVDCGGDVDGDGIADLLIGAPTYESQGAAFLYSVAGATGELGVDDATARLSGEGAEDFAGAAVAIVPDLDGDGFDEIVVGMPGYRSQGAVALVFGTGP